MASEAEIWQLDGHAVEVTNLDRAYWPDNGLTKRDLLTYLRDLAPVMLPYFADRPVTMRVYPGGITKASHYRRDLPDGAPDWLRRVEYQPATAKHVTQLPIVESAAGLVWLANTGAIEFHLWACRAASLDSPDLALIDLDPGDEAPFVDVLRAARIVRTELERLGLRSAAKTSGGRGLHLYLPLAPVHTFAQVRSWIKGLAERLEAAHPRLIATARGATHRGNLVTIDYAQNSVGRNTAAPYTPRARSGAPVSAPLTGREIAAGRVRPEKLTIRTMRARVAKLGDPFAEVLHNGQRLPPLS